MHSLQQRLVPVLAVLAASCGSVPRSPSAESFLEPNSLLEASLAGPSGQDPKESTTEGATTSGPAHDEAPDMSQIALRTDAAPRRSYGGSELGATFGSYVMAGESGDMNSTSPFVPFGQVGGRIELNAGPLSDFSFAAGVRPETDINGTIGDPEFLPLRANLSLDSTPDLEVGVGLTTAFGNTLYAPRDPKASFLPPGGTELANSKDAFRFTDGVFTPTLHEHSILGVSLDTRIEQLRLSMAVGAELRDRDVESGASGYLQASLPIDDTVELSGTLAASSDRIAVDAGAWVRLEEDTRIGVNAYWNSQEGEYDLDLTRGGAELRLETRNLFGVTDLGFAGSAIIERAKYPGNPDGAPGDTIPPFTRDGLNFRAGLEYRLTPHANVSVVGTHGDDGDIQETTVGAGISFKF